MRPGDILPTYEQLGGLDEPAGLFEAAADLAVGVLGTDRAVVAAVADGRVGAPAGASRRGRPLLQSLDGRPVAAWEDRDRADVAPALDRAGLEPGHRVAAWIAPDGPPVALLVAERLRGPLRAADHEAAGHLAAVIALALERAVLRRRARAFAAEVARFGAVARGIAGEVLDHEPALPDHVVPAVPGPAADGVLERLTPQEKRVAILLSEGRSNAAIGEILLLAPDTVKAHAQRIRRKLGAANRVELIALILDGTRR